MGSLEPIQIDDEFKELLKEPFMGKHLHIALQTQVIRCWRL